MILLVVALSAGRAVVVTANGDLQRVADVRAVPIGNGADTPDAVESTRRATTELTAGGRVGATAGRVPVLLRDIGGPPDDPGELNSARGVAIGTSGHLFVADYDNRRVQRFSPDGHFLDEWPFAIGAGSLPLQPYSVATDGRGHVYLISAGTVAKFTEAGAYLRSWSEAFGTFLTGIAADAAGHVYVVDSGRDRVRKFNDQGQFLLEWGSQGTNEGQFLSPQAIAVDGNGFIYVTDGDLSATRPVQKFSQNGGYVSTIGSSTPGDPNYVGSDGSRGVAVAGNGDVYVAAYQGQIVRFNATGASIGRWGVDGSGIGQIRDIYGLAVGSLERVYAADPNNGRITVFEADGAFVISIGESSPEDMVSPRAVAVGSSGNIYVLDRVQSRVVKFSASGTFATSWGGYGSLAGQFREPNGLALGPDETVFVVESLNGRVQVFSTDGTLQRVIATTGGPQDVAVGSDGSLYVLFQNHVKHLDAQGQLLEQWSVREPGSPDFSSAIAVAMDTADNIYVVGSFGSLSDERVRKFASDGQFLAGWGQPDEFWQALGLGVDPDGNLLVAHNHHVSQYSSAGVSIAMWDVGGQPGDVATSPSGDVMVTDWTNDVVHVFGYLPDPNLRVSALKAPPSVAGGTAVVVTTKTKNEGPGPSPTSDTRVWLSSNKTLGDDTLLSTRAVPGLAAGAVSTDAGPVAVPAVPPGIYYLIAEADGAAEVTETHEGDNLKVTRVMVGPNLVAALALSPSTPVSGVPTTITVNTTNAGGATASPSVTRLYRSADGKVGGSDTLLGTFVVPALAPIGVHTGEVTLTLPSGSYYLLAKADADDVVIEAKETDNLKKVKVVVAVHDEASEATGE
jgi:sugar lactone lactonase YvrE